MDALNDKLSSVELRIDYIITVLHHNRSSWYGNVLGNHENVKCEEILWSKGCKTQFMVVNVNVFVLAKNIKLPAKACGTNPDGSEQYHRPEVTDVWTNSSTVCFILTFDVAYHRSSLLAFIIVLVGVTKFPILLVSCNSSSSHSFQLKAGGCLSPTQ